MEIRGGADGNTRSNYRDSNQTKTLRLGRAKQKTATGLLEERKNTISQTYPRDGRGLETSYRAIQELLGCIPSYQNIDGNCGAVVAEPTILSGPAFRNNQNDKELG